MLADSEIRAFERTGFMGPYDLPDRVLDGFTQAVPLDTLDARLDDQNRYVLRNQHLYSRSLVDLVTADAILERVKALLGPDVLLWVAHVVSRKPGSRGRLWHVDAINRLVRGIHVSLALTDMTRHNGCLHVIPGSHLYRTSLATREPVPGDEAPTELADREAPWGAPHRAVDLEVKAGQFLFMWGGLWHGVRGNCSDRSRLACVARFARTDVKCADYGYNDGSIASGPRIPCILVAGEDRFGFNRIVDRPGRDFLADAGFVPAPPFDPSRMMKRVAGHVGRVVRRGSRA